MRRRAFLINSSVILLLIPLMLLLATYEDVSYQVIHAQSERMQLESTFNVISYLELDFQRALEISGKRAVVAVVDYVAVTGNFIDPSYGANNTIRDLIINGSSPSIQNYPRVSLFVGNGDIRTWISNISAELEKQGFYIQPNSTTIADHIQITVAPLDSFRLVVRGRILNVTVRSRNGVVVYSGALPRTGWVYSIIDIRDLEDPMFSAMTGGRYQRSIRACQMPFPQLFSRPLEVLEGNGSSSESHVIGELSASLESGKIYFGDSYPGAGAEAYVLANGSINVTSPIIVNTTSDGKRTSPVNVFSDGDMGVMVFDNVSGVTPATGWCSLLGYRFNVTIQNNLAQDLTDFQVPIYIDSSHVANLTLLNTFFNTADSDGDNIPIIEITYNNCTPVNFWIEKWNTTTEEAIIWVNVTIPASSQVTLEIYFDSSGTETLGDPNKVFEFYDDFSGSTLNTSKWEQYNAQVSLINGILRITNDYAGIYTKKTFNPPVIIEFRENIKNSWAELYIAVRQYSYPKAWGPLWWVRNNWIQSASWSYLDDHFYGSYTNVYPYLPVGWHKGTIYWFTYNSRLEWDTGEVIYNLYNTYQNYNGAIALGTWDRNQEWDWIRVRKYARQMPSVQYPTIIEQKPSQTSFSSSPARAYDIQPFINCIQDNRYFGIYGGWSFFERLEGSSTNHDAYVTLAHRMQDELGIKYGSQYYPIGLVSFMIPGSAPYDQALLNILSTAGISTTDMNSNQESSVDYYFLEYYFNGGSKVSGSRVWGISYGIIPNGDLSTIPFFLDNQTAAAIFGTQGAQDLLQR